MISVGETLRRERLRTGLDLESISRDTKISVRMLELIEADQFEKLPGGVFARSFVRQYARALGLDDEELVREVGKTVPAVTEQAPTPPYAVLEQAEIHVPRVAQWGGSASRLRPASSLPALALVFLVILGCSAVYTWWQKALYSPATGTEHTQARPLRRPAAAPEAEAQREVQSAVQAPEPAEAAVAPATAEAAGALQIGLTAEEETWVRATSNGKVVFSGILQPHETKALTAAEIMVLRLGNAGGVTISLNGKSLPAVGPKGQVRTVQLSPNGGVQIVAPVKVQPAEPAPPAQQTQSL